MSQHKSSSNTKKPWPTKAAMQQVYEQNLWGSSLSEASEFYSGEGSHRQDLVKPYVEAVCAFLSSEETPLSVCDLGCGDFNVGKQLVGYSSRYTAVDIVPELIASNRARFKHDHLAFQCLDVAVDDLPQADCALLRQVLQHLSNAEIKCIVAKLAGFQTVILTEHLPAGEFEPNKDIISGQGIRLKKGSGVNVLAPPFNLNVLESKPLLSIALGEGKGVIKTTLYRMF